MDWNIEPLDFFLDQFLNDFFGTIFFFDHFFGGRQTIST